MVRWLIFELRFYQVPEQAFSTAYTLLAAEIY
jgi:hypothetical protein